jgi:hypothetical protein
VNAAEAKVNVAAATPSLVVRKDELAATVNTDKMTTPQQSHPKIEEVR